MKKHFYLTCTRVLTLCLASFTALTLVPQGKAERTIESLSYLYIGGTANFLNNINRTRENLTTVMPDYFEVTPDGNVIQTKKPDKHFIETMNASGIKVIPYLSNHFDREKGRAAMKNGPVIAAQLAEWTREYGYDGLDVDIENLNQDDRAAFTAFMRLLRDALPRDKTLSVCVAANPRGLTTGWHGQYDMKALGKICDTVFVMTYDDHYDGDSVPGAVAGLPFIEASIKKALLNVPAQKLMIGVPFYGRYWIEGQERGGKALTVSDINNLVSRYESTLWYDKTADSARAVMTISEGDVASGLWGGKKLQPGAYDIWYENEQSLEKKLALVRKYNLKGIGSWALGQEPEQFWINYKRWLYGYKFVDVAGSWFEPSVIRLYNSGIVSGISDTQFAPYLEITRAEAVTLLCKILGLEQSDFPVPADSKGHWAQGYIAAALAHGLASGLPDGSFAPNAPITRQEMAVLTAKAIQTETAIDYGERVFSDVERGSWSNDAIITLSVYNIVAGYPDGTFKPGNKLARAEAASIIDKIVDFPKNPALYSRRRTQEPIIEPR